MQIVDQVKALMSSPRCLKQREKVNVKIRDLSNDTSGEHNFVNLSSSDRTVTRRPNTGHEAFLTGLLSRPQGVEPVSTAILIGAIAGAVAGLCAAILAVKELIKHFSSGMEDIKIAAFCEGESAETSTPRSCSLSRRPTTCAGLSGRRPAPKISTER